MTKEKGRMEIKVQKDTYLQARAPQGHFQRRGQPLFRERRTRIFA
jgi:hypothetical protein